MSSLHQLLRHAGPLRRDTDVVGVVQRALAKADPPPAAVAWRFTIERDELGQIQSMLATPVPVEEVQQ